MPMRVEEITEEALALPSEARALLVDRLVESLDPVADNKLHQSWADEAKKRLAELRGGAVKGIPGDVVFTNLRAKYQ